MTLDAPPTRTRRAFARVRDGVVHYAEAGTGDAVLLLHQTPRSWDEYRDVLPILGRRVRAIAMDTIGFGDSSPPPWPDSIEGYARVAAELLDVLGIERASVVGHHTGGVIAIELAASHPERVERLVLSSTPFVDDEFRRERAEGPRVDAVAASDDGTHLVELWRFRQAFYPPGRPDLLERFLIDALRAGERRERGHLAVHRYEMEATIDRVRAPALLIRATDDPFAVGHVPRLAERLPGATVVEIQGGMVPLPDQLPEQFAGAVLDFLENGGSP